MAFLLLFFASLTLLGSVDIADVHGAGWTSRDPLLVTLAALRLVRQLGRRPLFLLVALAITVLWVSFGTLGRTIILRRFSSNRPSIGFRNVLALQTWRAVFLWVGISGATAVLMFCAWMAMRGEKPDYVIFYALVFPLSVVIGIFCSVVNWYLSLAMVCTEGNETSGVAIQRAMVLTGTQPAAVVGISAFFLVLRLLAFLVAFVLAVFSAGLMVSSSRLLLAWLVVVALAYCALSDFLYACRLAAYAALKVAVVEAAPYPSIPPLPETPLTTTSNGHR